MPDLLHTKLLARKISDFCRLRIDPILPPQDSTRTKEFLLDLIARSQTPPCKVRGYDWNEIARQCCLDQNVLRDARAVIEPALDAIVRNTKNPSKRPSARTQSAQEPAPRPRRGRLRKPPLEKAGATRHFAATDRSQESAATKRKKPGTTPRTIEEFPTPRFDDWIDPPDFQEALELHMRRHGDSYWHLHRSVIRDDEKFDHSTIRHWLQGSKAPRGVSSMEVLVRPGSAFNARRIGKEICSPTQCTTGSCRQVEQNFA